MIHNTSIIEAILQVDPSIRSFNRTSFPLRLDSANYASTELAVDPMGTVTTRGVVAPIFQPPSGDDSKKRFEGEPGIKTADPHPRRKRGEQD